ncbi:ribosomal protein S18 acetylase RimI-like enzyme [Kroppenstedtia sanguinis]|uniref:GNAT family N-acetyltransferase n=1 Tax=Kroppenstedtia sanguinis TaxID=1380684 RepID=A0ABW4C5G9_9BACL
MRPYDIRHELPPVDDYVRLRKIAGLSERSREAATIGLKNSLFSVCVYSEDQLIGMGRLVGDGGCNFEVVDVAVDPEFQGRGIGQEMMKAITEYLDHHAPDSAYVSLIADVPADRLYKKFGFDYTVPSVGMYKRY